MRKVPEPLVNEPVMTTFPAELIVMVSALFARNLIEFPDGTLMYKLGAGPAYDIISRL